MSGMGLTAKQRELLAYIKSCDLSPTYPEMRAALGLKSNSQVACLVKGLEERGRITRQYGMPRSIVVLPDLPEPESWRLPRGDWRLAPTSIPLLGRINHGDLPSVRAR